MSFRIYFCKETQAKKRTKRNHNYDIKK